MPRLACTLLAALVIAVPAAEPDPAAILEAHAPALVRVTVASTFTVQRGGGGRDRSTSRELTGAVIDDQGTIVLADRLLDRLQRFRGRHGGQPGAVRMSLKVGPDGTVEYGNDSFSERLDALTIHANDGREIPATLLGRDDLLGVSFLRPTEPPADPLPHLSLPASTDGLALLDAILVVGRLDEGLDRQATLVPGRITALIPGADGGLLTDAARQPGVAGGAACRPDGSLVGLLLGEDGERDHALICNGASIAAARQRAEDAQAAAAAASEAGTAEPAEPAGNDF